METQESHTFLAKFPGVCHNCDGKIIPGMLVKYDKESKLIMENCDEAPDDEEDPFSEEEKRKARAEMCRKCFLVHKGECL